MKTEIIIGGDKGPLGKYVKKKTDVSIDRMIINDLTISNRGEVPLYSHYEVTFSFSMKSDKSVFKKLYKAVGRVLEFQECRTKQD